ncbi:MAG: hypothetical protein Q7T80_02915 [Methanoregula sp.]|nr:hypothetical protein [Methanoregula sp.]
MQISRTVFVIFLIGAAIFCAGCTQSTAPGTVVPGSVTVMEIDPVPLSLTPSDVPQDFVLTENRTKGSSDMGSVAMGMGWQGGHVIRFTSPAHDGKAGYEITHSIAIYPAGSIPDVIAISEKQARSDPDIVYSDFTVQGLGESARGFSGIAGVQQPARTAVSNPVFAGYDDKSVQTGIKTNFSEIIFSKGNTFEVIKITGPYPDNAMLINLSQKAYAKIP